MFADISRLRITYGEPASDLPASVIIKLSSTNQQMRDRPNTRKAYAREVHFYRHLGKGAALPTPRCFHADVDPGTGHHVLVLEDLAPARSLQARDGATTAQAELAVTQVAQFHAQWWDSRALDEIAWIDEPVVPSASAMRDLHDTWWSSFTRTAANHINDSVLALGERLANHRVFLQQQLFALAPRTLIHRDYSIANMMFAASGKGRPFTVIDWQSVTRGRGAWDVAWFIGQSLTIEHRREVEQHLLALYHAKLAESGVTYGFDALLRDYRLALLQRFGSLISTIAAMPMTPKQLELVADVLLPRNLAALEDHQAADELG